MSLSEAAKPFPHGGRKREHCGLGDIIAQLRAAERFLITTHVGPDGDAIGSMLGVYHLLRAMGKEHIVCAHNDAVPRTYQWLPGQEHIRPAKAVVSPFDVAIIVDASQTERVGRCARLVDGCDKIVVIDHHLDDEPCGDYNFVDASYAAVGEIVVELFDAADLPLSLEAAQCAYTAIVTDTGSFRFSNTGARTHRLVSRLLDAGINVAEISSHVFDEMSVPKFNLMVRVVNRVELLEDGRLAHTHVCRKDFEEVNATDDDLEGLINFARNIEGVEVAILFREIDAQTTKMSFRSHDGFNSAAALQPFGGGGHAAAAGATVSAPLDQVRADVLAHVRGILGGHTNE